MIWNILFAAHLVWAEDVCVQGFRVTPQKIHAIPNGASYFIRSAPGAREVSFGSLDENTPSQILNVDTGKRDNIGGSYDPVESPDGALLTIPQGFMYDAKSGKAHLMEKSEYSTVRYTLDNGQIYDAQDSGGKTKLTKEDLERQKLDYAYPAMTFYARDSKGEFKLIHAAVNESMSYQSLGLVSEQGAEKRYRMLFKGDRISYQDYVFNAGKNMVEAVGAHRTVCKEAAGGDLPMLSKDGHSFSAYDEDKRVVEIYQMDAQGNCRRQDTLPSMTGKIDFSPDGKLLAFQLDEAAAPGEHGDREFQRPSNSQRLRAYVYDREAKRLTVLDHEPSGHTYFPVFLGNDELAYLHADEDPTSKAMQVKLVKIEKTEPPRSTCRGCDAMPRLQQASRLLAKLYAQKCNPVGFDEATLGQILSWLTPLSCQTFVRSLPEQTWNERTANASALNPVNRHARNSGNFTKSDFGEVCRHLSVPSLNNATEAKAAR